MTAAFAIEFAGATKRYGATAALDALNLRIPAGGIVALLGSSGSGKSTALRLINGMLIPDSGSVLVDGRDVRGWDRVALRRAMGYVSQEGGLFPHWRAEDNVALVPRLLGWNHTRVHDGVVAAMDAARLPHAEFGKRYPGSLSGGQRQRLALARAIAAGPRALLMDEPFSALDPVTRLELRREVLGLSRRLGMTTIIVTHDLIEAITMADEVAVLHRGRLVQKGRPAELVMSPSPGFASEFIADQALTLRLLHLHLHDLADFLIPLADDGTAVLDLPPDAPLAEALATIAAHGIERFRIRSAGSSRGPYSRRAAWELLQAHHA